MEELAVSSAPVVNQRSVASVIAAELRPLVRRIDEEGFYPADVMRSLGEAGAYGHHAGGPSNGDLYGSIAAMAEVGATCVSTGFCMWCQDALVWYLASSANQAAQQRHLAAAASGRLLGGTGLSNPMKALAGFEPLALKGVRTDGGYRVTGRLPFVSNLGEGHRFAGIFRVDGAPERLVMAVFQAGHDNVGLAQNAHFIGLEGTATYSVLIRDSFVSDDDVLSEDATAFLPLIRKGFVLLQCGFGIGSARGAANLMRTDSTGRRLAAHLPIQPDAIDARCDALMARIETLCAEPQETDRAKFLEVLQARLDVSWLALEAAQAAMLQFGARGYLIGSEAARRLREAQFVAIVTPSIKHITTELANG
jgi:alkylation response protein AidB-like acyl-CoA dehydrogenase